MCIRDRAYRHTSNHSYKPVTNVLNVIVFKQTFESDSTDSMLCLWETLKRGGLFYKIRTDFWDDARMRQGLLAHVVHLIVMIPQPHIRLIFPHARFIFVSKKQNMKGQHGTTVEDIKQKSLNEFK